MNSHLRLLLSATVAFAFYFVWTYWANSMATEDMQVVLRAALVQATLSASVTLGFTFALEWSVKRYGAHSYSLMFVVPILCGVHSKTRQNIAIFRTFSAALDKSAKAAEGACLPGTLFAPLLPLTVQACLVISANLLNQTPNLWLTVAPSLFFTALYGYVYTFTLLKERPEASATID